MPYKILYPRYPVKKAKILSKTFIRGVEGQGAGGIPSIFDGYGSGNVTYYISQYDGAIRFVDTQIGILLEHLKHLGLDENTLLKIVKPKDTNFHARLASFSEAGIKIKFPRIFTFVYDEKYSCLNSPLVIQDSIKRNICL